MSEKASFLLPLAPIISPLIWVCAAIALVFLILATVYSKKILKELSKHNEAAYKLSTRKFIRISYDVFTAGVTSLPLLGMLGTVLALLSLDISAEAADSLKQNFFLALDTTALGLFFSIILKAIHSVLQTDIETAIAKIDELTKNV